MNVKDYMLNETRLLKFVITDSLDIYKNSLLELKYSSKIPKHENGISKVL